jgi:hypothetical protein
MGRVFICNWVKKGPLCVFICNWIKKRREPRANNVTLKNYEELYIKKNPFFVCDFFVSFFPSLHSSHVTVLIKKIKVRIRGTAATKGEQTFVGTRRKVERDQRF